MDVQPGDAAEEIKRLQRCVNDLISVLALPATWSGGEPSQIVHTLLGALLPMLQLDLVYVRLKETGGQGPIEMAAQSHKYPGWGPTLRNGLRGCGNPWETETFRLCR